MKTRMRHRQQMLEQAAGTPDLPRLQALDFREKLAVARVRAGDLTGARSEYASILASARSSSQMASVGLFSRFGGRPMSW